MAKLVLQTEYGTQTLADDLPEGHEELLWEEAKAMLERIRTVLRDERLQEEYPLGTCIQIVRTQPMYMRETYKEGLIGIVIWHTPRGGLVVHLEDDRVRDFYPEEDELVKIGSCNFEARMRCEAESFDGEIDVSALSSCTKHSIGACEETCGKYSSCDTAALCNDLLARMEQMCDVAVEYDAELPFD